MNREVEIIKSELLSKGYSAIAIQHWLFPHNLGGMSYYSGFSGKISSSCGDSISIWVVIKNDIVIKSSFISDICPGAVSSGSMLTELLKGKTTREALQIEAQDILNALGDLPEEHRHCAKIAQQALKYALADYFKNKAAPWDRIYKPR